MSSKLPIFHSEDQNFSLMQTSWASVINPVLGQPFSDGLLLKGQTLVNGANVINHKLGRKLQGWIITRFQNAFVQIYDTQNTNQTPAITLALTTNGAVTVDIFVF